MLSPARCISLAIVASGLLSSAPTVAQPSAAQMSGTSNAHRAIVTRHHGMFNGKALSYTATVEGLDVAAPDGVGGAHVVSFAYTADRIANGSGRPILFLFNGGPITSSLWIHIGGLGPKRIAFPDDVKADPATFKLVDNTHSPLDVADLVFVDPASTGFSYILPGTRPDIYQSVAGDGQQFAAFIEVWLKKHGRTSSPIYIAGESYGTIRAPEIVRQLAERADPVPVAGIVMIGQAVNIIEYSQRPDNIISYVTAFPTLSATAWYHGRANTGSATFDEFMASARKFAQTDYLVALFQGVKLPPEERDRVAAKLADYTGIPASYYASHDLRITKELFRSMLLSERGLLLGRNDARYTEPMTDKGLAPDPFDIVMPAFTNHFNQYLHKDLRIDWPEQYVEMASPKGGLNGWQWGGASPFTSWAYGAPLTKLMAMDPKFKVFVAAGYYDTQTSIGAADYLVSQPGWRENQVTLRHYQGGHVTYTVESAAKALGDDLRTFMTVPNANGEIGK